MSVRQCNDIGTVRETWIVIIGPVDIDVILQVDRSWQRGIVRERPMGQGRERLPACRAPISHCSLRMI